MKGLMAIAGICIGGGLFAQGPAAPPAAPPGPEIEVRGVVSRLQAVPGQGMPYLEMDAGGKQTKVHLGSMRYLMANDFNPKAGDEITVKGYRLNGEVIARSVRLTASGKTLELRDKQGFPLWQRGRQGQRRQRGYNRGAGGNG
jgi:hypothetical protein